MDTYRLKSVWLSRTVVVFFAMLLCKPCEGQFFDYFFEGVITEVTENENDVIPGLAVGDDFGGALRFDSRGWNDTAGIISVYVNGVQLLHEGDSLYGDMNIDPFYSLRIAADAGGNIRNSTFSAVNFGLSLEDMDPSIFYTGAYPTFLGPDDYEKNEFNILGSVIASNDRVDAVGELTWLGEVAVDCFGDVDGDFDTDTDDFSRFADVLGESALFHHCFEMDGDGVITLADHDALITTWANVSSGINGTFIGDLNLDGSVDVLSDAFTLVSNLGQEGTFGYADGDLNADNRVDVLGDGFRLIENLGKSHWTTLSPSAAAVPEPGGALILLAAAIFFNARRNRA